MALNIIRTGTAAVVGAASGGLDADPTRVWKFGAAGSETVICYGTIVEAVALVAGAGLQLMMPFMAPNLADGAVDAGAALLAARGTRIALKPAAAGYTYPSRMVGALNAGVPANMYSRAQIGNLPVGSRKVKLG